MQLTHKIAVIDSGAGGISILTEIIKKLTQEEQTLEQYIYIADHAGFPYGELNEGILLARLHNIVSHTIENYQPHIIVIACNTASTLALDHLRSQFPDIQFVGVVPAIKPANQISQTKHIGILATPATVNRKYTLDLINEFAHDCTVSFCGSTQLVHVAENFISSDIIATDIIMQEIEALLKQDEKIDTIVLACTHFPLIKNAIHQCATSYYTNNHRSSPVYIIDSGEAVARRVSNIIEIRKQMKERLEDEDSDKDNNKGSVNILYLSTNEENEFIEQLCVNYDRYIKSSSTITNTIQSQALHLRLAK